MKAKKIVALVMGGISIEVPINLVLVYDGCVVAIDRELALAFLHSETRGTLTLRCFKTNDEIVCMTVWRLLVETLTTHCRWQAVR